MIKIVVIRWKRVLICLLVFFIGLSLAIHKFTTENAATSFPLNESCKLFLNPNEPAQCSIEELYKDISMTLLLPCINEAVKNYYESRTGLVPSVDPWQPKILMIERPHGYRTFLFTIQLEVSPYLGAHISIGVDHITLLVSAEEVKVINFEHIRDYPIPPWLR